MEKVPGIRGIEHIGITVPDLNQAIHFFVKVLGCEHIYDIGPFRRNDNWMQEHLNVDARAEIPRIAVLKCHQASNIELFEYKAPAQNQAPPRNSDIGGHHMAFYVDDMPAAVASLKANGLTVFGEPTLMTEGASSGECWVYFLSPWGMQLELITYPKGKAYEENTRQRLFTPEKSTDDQTT